MRAQLKLMVQFLNTMAVRLDGWSQGNEHSASMAMSADHCRLMAEHFKSLPEYRGE